MVTTAQVTWFSETKISLFSFEINRQHQSPKAGPKVERGRIQTSIISSTKLFEPNWKLHPFALCFIIWNEGWLWWNRSFRPSFTLLTPSLPTVQDNVSLQQGIHFLVHNISLHLCTTCKVSYGLTKLFWSKLNKFTVL